jgi:hypothetical protein
VFILEIGGGGSLRVSFYKKEEGKLSECLKSLNLNLLFSVESFVLDLNNPFRESPSISLQEIFVSTPAL